jgi:hypothetical protein
MQSKSHTSSKPFFKEDLQWQIKNSKLSFRGRTSEGDFTAEFFPKSWEGEDFFHGEKIICEGLFQRNPTECAQTYQERFSAVTWQKIAAFPEPGLKLEGVVRGKNKVCDLREPSRGPNIELSEARSHQPVLVCVSFLHPKTGWWLRASDNSMLGPRDGSLNHKLCFLLLTTPIRALISIWESIEIFSVESLLKIFLDMMGRPQTTTGFPRKRTSQIIFSPWKKSSPFLVLGRIRL